MLKSQKINVPYSAPPPTAQLARGCSVSLMRMGEDLLKGRASGGKTGRMRKGSDLSRKTSKAPHRRPSYVVRQSARSLGALGLCVLGNLQNWQGQVGFGKHTCLWQPKFTSSVGRTKGLGSFPGRTRYQHTQCALPVVKLPGRARHKHMPWLRGPAF